MSESQHSPALVRPSPLLGKAVNAQGPDSAFHRSRSGEIPCLWSEYRPVRGENSESAAELRMCSSLCRARRNLSEPSLGRHCDHARICVDLPRSLEHQKLPKQFFYRGCRVGRADARLFHKRLCSGSPHSQNPSVPYIDWPHCVTPKQIRALRLRETGSQSGLQAVA